MRRVGKFAANTPFSGLFSVNHLPIWTLKFLKPDITKIMSRYDVQYLQHLLDGLSLSLDGTDQIIDNLLVFHTFNMPYAPFNVGKVTIGFFQPILGGQQFCF